ncbi:hypothetical protein [Streptomyces sp. 5-10]|uniref:hypothetical protein n=1 Tax=Streptomyces sp. 5-10 TaxID=878925 RepID=UPI00168AA822|nr:hypothetical protein [Streptomyces sp. 5-10]MBD3004683.1 hypothetical protein [Streptomyces sp. 5-10]
MPDIRRIYFKGSPPGLPDDYDLDDDYADEIMEVLAGELTPNLTRTAGFELSTHITEYTDPRARVQRWVVEVHRWADFWMYDFSTPKGADAYSRTLFNRAGLTYTEEVGDQS